MTLVRNTLALALFAGVLGVFLYVAYHTYPAQGSAQVGQEYLSVYLTSSDAAATTTLRLGHGSVGSVVVSEDGTGGAIDFYDMASTTAATSSDDLMFTFDGVAAEGTYTYDAAFNSGLLIDVNTGFDGEITVTYR